MKTKRLNPKGLASREEFTAVVDEIAVLQTTQRALEARRDALIQRVQERYRERIDTAAGAIEHRLAQAEAYAREHRAELLGDRQTGETELATYGFRGHPPALVPLNKKFTWADIITKVKEAFGRKFIRVEESVDKDALRTSIDEAKLEPLGLKIRRTESFGVTPKVDGGETAKAS
jgi:phage host-nuclease inhibitor protein Gam